MLGEMLASLPLITLLNKFLLNLKYIIGKHPTNRWITSIDNSISDLFWSLAFLVFKSIFGQHFVGLTFSHCQVNSSLLCVQAYSLIFTLRQASYLLLKRQDASVHYYYLCRNYFYAVQPFVANVPRVSLSNLLVRAYHMPLYLLPDSSFLGLPPCLQRYLWTPYKPKMRNI